MVIYKYSAWGNVSVLDGSDTVNTSGTFIGNINPFRYKGYYYDKETGLYLVTSRYYNPEWCRWLNADSIRYLEIGNLDVLNLFAYCENSPVMYKQGSTNQITNSLKKVGLNGLYILSFDYKKNHRNPNHGTPGSVGRIFYPDGSPKQEREYGPDGRPSVDHDHHLGEEAGYDHDHDWDWGKQPPRQPARDPNKIIAAFGLIGSGFALIWFVGNDFTGVGVADDGMVPVMATSFMAFFTLLFGKGDNDKW